MIVSFQEFLRGGTLRKPLVSLNAVTARAEVGDEAFEFHRRMRTKTPLHVWTCKAAPRNAPVMDVDTDDSAAVINPQGLTQAITAFVAESGATAEVVCFPASSKAKPHMTGFRTVRAANGDVWLVRDYITPAVFADYMNWDYGATRNLASTEPSAQQAGSR